jgi:predicted Abi (CAAX) family protease
MSSKQSDPELIEWLEQHAEATELRDFARLAELEDMLESRAISELN